MYHAVVYSFLMGMKCCVSRCSVFIYNGNEVSAVVYSLGTVVYSFIMGMKCCVSRCSVFIYNGKEVLCITL